MQNKTLIVLIALAVFGTGSTALAKGGGMAMGGMAMHGHGHFAHHGHFRHHFLRNQFFGNGWGWGWDWGLGPYNGEGTNTTVVVSQPPVSRFPTADATGSTAATPCHLKEETFTVPSSAGGTRPVSVVGCR